MFIGHILLQKWRYCNPKFEKWENAKWPRFHAETEKLVDYQTVTMETMTTTNILTSAFAIYSQVPQLKNQEKNLLIIKIFIFLVSDHQQMCQVLLKYIEPNG